MPERRDHRVLLGRVRAAPVAADLRRWPRRAGRRPLQGGQRPRRAAGGRRLHVPAGLLPPAHVQRRLAGGALRAARRGPTRRSKRRSRPRARPCVTAVPLGDRTVLAAVWRVRLGRVRLFLLDTDLAENAPWDRELSARLYGGDRETRIQQEIILGIGGVRALRALGISPDGVAPERGPRGVRGPAAHPRAGRAGASRSTPRSTPSDGRRSSPRTPRCPPATTRSRSSRSRSTWPAAGASWAASRALPRARRVRQRAAARCST